MIKHKKTGLMGGSFNPFHFAHLHCLLYVKKKFNLDNLIVIPSFKTPLQTLSMELPVHRLNMLKAALKPYPFIQIDTQEITRQGTSYTYKTIAKIDTSFRNNDNYQLQTSSDNVSKELFFIVGLDQFYIFDCWKRFTDILKQTHLIVVSRPGFIFPKVKSDFPHGLQDFIDKIAKQVISLKLSDKKIFFCTLDKPQSISSSFVRKNIKEKKDISYLIPSVVESYIKKHHLYTQNKNIQKHQDFIDQKLLDFSVKELQKKKAYDIQVFDLNLKPLPFSFGLIATASNTRQTKALASHIKQKIKEYFGLNPISCEGEKQSCWIALDYGSLVIHIFYDYTKKIYNLQDLWKSLPDTKQAIVY